MTGRPLTARQNLAVLETCIAYPEVLDALLLTPEEFAAVPHGTNVHSGLLVLEEAIKEAGE